MIAALSDTYLAHALETALAVTLLILLVLAIRKPVARHFGAGLAYALWLLPVARLLLPPLPNQASLLGWIRQPATSPDPVTPDFTVHAVHGDGAWLPSPTLAAETAPALPPGLTDAPEAAGLAMASSDLLALAGIAGLAVWLAGVVFLLGRSLRTHVQFMAVVEREGLPVTGDLEALSLEVAREAGLKRMPRVVTSLISSGPFVTGLLRPAVVLPAWFAEDYSRTEARAAIAHELTHVKRGDLWALQMSEIFVALMWFNPLAYIARQAFRTDQEAACDADVLRRGHASPHAYGATLVKAVRMQMPARIALTTSLPLTHALKERLKLMSYPAPDTRRRWIGFGAAVLLGTTALVGTASVAAAGENNSKDLKIEDGAVWLDGEKIDNRQIILLTDPVKDLVPPEGISPEISELALNISLDVEELTGPDALGPVIDLSNDPDFMEITRLSTELAMMGADLGTQAAFESLSMTFEGKSEEEIEAWAEEFEARMEAKAAEIEARAEAMEARIESRNEAIDARMDAAQEARIIAIERRIEADAARIEAEVERRFGDEFSARIESRTALIPELVKECASLNLPDGETRIVERAAEDGEMIKLACIAGGADAVRANRTIAFIDAQAGLSEAEKENFREHLSPGRKRTFVFSDDKSTDRTVHILRAPAAPEAPEAPNAPEMPEELQGAD